MQPLVTVIIPSYNHEQYVGEAIQSVLHQTYDNWELIVIDDVSPDSTYDIAKLILQNESSRATCIRKEQNAGAVDSYNIGIAMAKGEYIAFLASDDQWEPEFLEVSVRCALRHKNSIVFSNAVGMQPYFQNEKLITANEMRKILLRCNPIYAIACLYPAGFMKSLIELDTRIYLEDYYIRWQAVFQNIDHYYTNSNLVRYRITENSMSKNKMKMAIARLALQGLVWRNLSMTENMLLLIYLNSRTFKSFAS